MEIKDLTKQLPYQWRVQSFSKSSKTATCVAYIDSRDVQRLLDEVCGAENWQDDYKEVKGNVYAGIGIKVKDEWVWKWDCGAESNIEKEKGEASDSFKRAGVKWGIGRFLYDLEIKTVNSNEPKGQSNYPYVVDENGKRVWNLTKYINDKMPTQQTPVSSVVEVKPVGLIDEIKKLGKENGFTGKTMEEFGLFIFTKTSYTLETKNYQLIIEKLKENLIK